jgi:hypothetical protein
MQLNKSTSEMNNDLETVISFLNKYNNEQIPTYIEYNSSNNNINNLNKVN